MRDRRGGGGVNPLALGNLPRGHKRPEEAPGDGCWLLEVELVTFHVIGLWRDGAGDRLD